MSGINYLAAVVAALAALLASMLWYILFAKQRRESSRQETTSSPDDMRRPRPGKMLIELVRNLVLALVLAYLVLNLSITNLSGALFFGMVAWVGFPLILLTGSALWENVPWKLAAIHAGDWLVKLLLMTAILGAWR